MQKNLLSVDDYIAQFPLAMQDLLNAVRQTIINVVPEATEEISYGMPTYKLAGNLVHFAGYKKHIGFYPGPQALSQFEKDITQYKSSKGAVQFPIDDHLPLKLIAEITKFCVVIRKKKITDALPVFNVSTPARRALANEQINSLQELSNYTEEYILALHGVGKTAIPILKAQLRKEGLSFKIGSGTK